MVLIVVGSVICAGTVGAIGAAEFADLHTNWLALAPFSGVFGSQAVVTGILLKFV